MWRVVGRDSGASGNECVNEADRRCTKRREERTPLSVEEIPDFDFSEEGPSEEDFYRKEDRKTKVS